MSAWRFILRSLSHHWRINAAVAMGVMAATAVLTGALLVGDSVRGSLRTLALDRLGQIDEVLVTEHFFRAELANELASDSRFKQYFTAATPAILFPQGTVEHRTDERTMRAGGVTVVGCDEAFWKLGRAIGRPSRLPGDGEIVLNAPLAEDLGVKVGDEVVLRLPKVSQVPADSALGKKADRVRSLAGLKVVAIVPAESLGRFSLRPSQSVPRNAYVSLTSLQDALQQEGRVNSVLVSSDRETNRNDDSPSRALAEILRPKFEDYGFRITHVRRTFHAPGSDEEQLIYDYFSFTSDTMMFEPAAEMTALQSLTADLAQPVFTYLANSISKIADDAVNDPASAKSTGIPYSTIAAIDSIPQLGPLLENGKPIELADDEIVLSSWAADDLAAQPGDKIRVSYFEPETTHGETVERSEDFTLKAIVPLTEPAEPFRRNRPPRFDQPPTLANDPDLTPEVPGITDQASIADWDAPFPFDYKRIRKQDDDYWENHRTTPKAFISLAAGQRLWRSRFGQVTSLRIPARDGLTEDRIQEKFLDQLARDRVKLGFEFIPVKRQGLQASSGTTPFDMLFLALSFFIITAAVMLVALLFRLGIEQRAPEIGTLLAVGLRQRLTGRLLVAEGALVAAIGGLAGVILGVGYAWLMIVGLHTIWVGAVTTAFLELHIGPLSLVIGYSSGVIVSVLTIAWSIRATRRVSVRRLLSGQASASGGAIGRRQSIVLVVLTLLAAMALLVVAVVLAIAATMLGGEAQAGAFVGSGASVLTALLIFSWVRLKAGGVGSMASTGGMMLARLATRNAGRNPSRSTMTIALIATASFLIVAMSSFRLAPTEEGTGGFDLLAESSQPVFADLNTAEGRKDLLADKAAILDGGSVLSLRVKPGDNASCNNLYKAAQPRVLGVTPTMIEHFNRAGVHGFSWAGSGASTDKQRANPWQLLGASTVTSGDAVPVVLDKNTAMYSLQLYKGIGEEFTFTYDNVNEVRFRVVGLLSNSILQGSLLVGEADFVKRFPQVSGYNYFLIQSPPGKSDQVTEVLEDKLSDQGFDAASTYKLLEQLLAVQNTYLSTFQSLGALGLLLGTFGLAAVQLRSVLERRGELALLRAAGFRRRRLSQMVLLENTFLLLGGLSIGIFAALLSVLPHMLIGGAFIPLVDLTVMLTLVLTAGLLSGLLAARATLRAPLLAALRGE
jgi:putative ABC transport system permease protein